MYKLLVQTVLQAVDKVGQLHSACRAGSPARAQSMLTGLAAIGHQIRLPVIEVQSPAACKFWSYTELKSAAWRGQASLASTPGLSQHQPQLGTHPGNGPALMPVLDRLHQLRYQFAAGGANLGGTPSWAVLLFLRATGGLYTRWSTTWARWSSQGCVCRLPSASMRWQADTKPPAQDPWLSQRMLQTGPLGHSRPEMLLPLPQHR